MDIPNLADNLYTQAPHRCRLAWSFLGVKQAVERKDIIVVVDNISFSSCVTTAINYGGIVYPVFTVEEAKKRAVELGAEAAVHRAQVPDKGRFSLSPMTYIGIEAGTKIVLASPNGAHCSEYGRDSEYLFAGCLLNAKAVADQVNKLLDTTDLSVTVIAAGEKWDESFTTTEQMRMAIEDYLGAGSILANLKYDKSAEAQVCEAAFLSCKDKVEELLWDSESGRELRAKGFGDDVTHCSQLNKYSAVGRFESGCFIPR